MFFTFFKWLSVSLLGGLVLWKARVYFLSGGGMVWFLLFGDVKGLFGVQWWTLRMYGDALPVLCFALGAVGRFKVNWWVVVPFVCCNVF